MEDREEAMPLKPSTALRSNSSSGESVMTRIGIGRVLLVLLFLSIGFVSTYQPRAGENPVKKFPSIVHPAVQRKDESELLSQVATDLSPFNNTRISNGISLQQVERVYCNFDQGGFRLQIVDGKMYVVGEQGSIQTRVRNTKLMFMHVMQKYKLPDVDIGWVSADDGVLDIESGRSNECPEQGPVLVMTKQPQHDHCIMYPDFSFWDWEEAHAVPWRDMSKVMLEAAEHQPWLDRKARLFARAFNLGEARNTLKDNEAVLGQEELIDARIIDWHVAPDSFVDLLDHCQYKWLLHTPGNTWSARLKYLLFCKSAVVIRTALGKNSSITCSSLATMCTASRA